MMGNVFKEKNYFWTDKKSIKNFFARPTIPSKKIQRGGGKNKKIGIKYTPDLDVVILKLLIIFY